MRQINRAIHLDFHTMPGITDFAQHYTAAEIAETLRSAHVDYINFFARCNIGFSYYPTKIGYPYPEMKGDLFGEVLTECHRRGIGVSAYIQAGLNHEYLHRHPECRRVREDGTPEGSDKVYDHFFRTPCFHSAYRQHLYAEIREVLAYGPDGIFCDGLAPRACYCPTCLAKMRAGGLDPTDQKQVYRFTCDTLCEVFREIRALVPSELHLYLNGFPYEGIYGLLSHTELESLPSSDEWGYDYFPTTAPYYRKLSKDRLYMTGKFLNSWGDLGGHKQIASLENDVYDALLYGYKPSIGDHMDPRRGLDSVLYRGIGKIYERVEQLEPYTDGTEALTEVAIFKNRFSYDRIGTTDDSLVGACRMLSELNVCHDVVDEDMDLSPYRLLILPSGIEMTEALLEKLSSFDGAILSTGNSIARHPLWSLIDEYAPDTNEDGFYRDGDKVFGCYALGIKMKSSYGIADYIEPYFNRHFDGRHGYIYVPSGECRGFCAVVRKDNVAHIAFDVFTAYANRSADFHKVLVKRLLDALLPNPLICADALPSTARVSLMQGKHTVLHVKTTYPELRGKLGVIEEQAVLPQGRKISVRGSFSSVISIPDRTPVPHSERGGYTEITLPEIHGYAAFLLQ